MKYDIDWMIETLDRSKTMLAKLRDDAGSHASAMTIRAAICQIDAAKIMAKCIQKDQENEPAK
jgi:hypothetical protein